MEEHNFLANVILERKIKQPGIFGVPIKSSLKFTLKAFGKSQAEAVRDVHGRLRQDYPRWIITGLYLDQASSGR